MLDERTALLWSTGVATALLPLFALALVGFRRHRLRWWNIAVVLSMWLIAARAFGQLTWQGLMGWWVTVPYLIFAGLLVLGVPLVLRLMFAGREREP